MYGTKTNLGDSNRIPIQGCLIRRLMEIMRANVGAGDVKRSYSMGLDVDYSILILQRTFYHEKSAARDDDTIAFKGIGGNDDVGDAGLIFEGKKDKSLGCTRPLPRDHTPGNTHKAVSLGVTQVLC